MKYKQKTKECQFVVGAKPNKLSAKAVKQISSAKMPEITKILISRASKANVKKGSM